MEAATTWPSLDKAAGYLRRASERLAVMAELPLNVELGAHEKLFHQWLDDMRQARDQLLLASVRLDGGCTGKRILHDQRQDPLLHYFQAACRAPSHPLLRTTLDVRDFHFEIIDRQRYRAARERYGFTDDFHAMLCIAFGTGMGFQRLQRKLREGLAPDRFAIKLAGLKLVRSWHSVALRDIDHAQDSHQAVRTIAPRTHLGAPLQPSVSEATDRIARYFATRWQELRSARPIVR